MVLQCPTLTLMLPQTLTLTDKAGIYAATGDGVTELVIVLLHGGSVTLQFNFDQVIEHPITRHSSFIIHQVIEHPIIQVIEHPIIHSSFIIQSSSY